MPLQQMFQAQGHSYTAMQGWSSCEGLPLSTGKTEGQRPGLRLKQLGEWWVQFLKWERFGKRQLEAESKRKDKKQYLQIPSSLSPYFKRCGNGLNSSSSRIHSYLGLGQQHLLYLRGDQKV